MNNITKIDEYNNQADEQAILDKRKLKRLSIKELMDLPYDEVKDHLPCRSNTMGSYKKGETHAYIWKLGSKKKKRIPLPLLDGCYVIGPAGIPNGKALEDDGVRRKLWRCQDRNWEGLLVRYDDFGGGRVVLAVCEPDYRFRVLAKSISKRNEEPDKAFDWLKAQAKKNKNAKDIMKRLNGCE